MKRSQSALEYMMTYGWAILIIVIVAGVLYSLGIFNPSVSAGTTVTGFGSLGSVQAQCVPGGGLVIQIGNSVGQTIQITRLNTTSSTGAKLAINASTTIVAGGNANFVIGNACSNSSNSRFSNTVVVTYTKPGQIFSGPFSSTGTVSGTTSKQATVAYFSNRTSGFINTSLSYTGSTNLTLTFWVKPEWWSMGIFGEGTNGTGWSITDGTNTGSNNQNIWFYSCNAHGNNGPGGGIGVLTNNTWNFATAVLIKNSTRNIKTVLLYVNGISVLNWTGPSGNMLTGLKYIIGRNSNCGPTSIYMNGGLADISIYNYSLSSSQIKTLSSNGIGSAPITSTNGLIAWWPLDGNPYDYSGNGNNGLASNVNWASP